MPGDVSELIGRDKNVVCRELKDLAPENIGIDPVPSSPVERYALVGSYPNPSPRPTIRFELPQAARVV